jgi:lysyl-tRNA synthetase class 2
MKLPGRALCARNSRASYKLNGRVQFHLHTENRWTNNVTEINPLTDELVCRRAKLERLRALGMQPYAERYERTHSPHDAAQLPDETDGVRVAGRVIALRWFGKLAFGHLADCSGKIQFALQRKALGEQFTHFEQCVDIGDFIGVEGRMFTTKTGEKTIDVQRWTFLSKALRNLPEKFHGLHDPELRMRRRYLETITNPASMARYRDRTTIIRAIRTYLDTHGFMEIDTPVLTNKASGAMATPFVTHYHALDIDVFLRIAPETYLKRAIAGGFDKVYEFARSFRNEGIDPSHLPDFTLLEYYCAYWNYEDNMAFTERLLKHIVHTLKGGDEVEYAGTRIAFDGAWPRRTFRELIQTDAGIDIDACPTRAALLAAIAARGITFDDPQALKGACRGTLIDILYKKVSRPKIVNPMFVTQHPLDLSPLARRNDTNPQVVDRFQLVVNGWEIVNAYSELVDPIDQAERFAQQAAARAAGDAEAMQVDEDFLLCMEYGMPPISGWGMGIDRVVALLTDTHNLRDVILFPLLRPEA